VGTIFRKLGMGLLIAGMMATVVYLQFACSDPDEAKPGSFAGGATMAEVTPSSPVDVVAPICPYFGIRVNGTEAQPTFGWIDDEGRLHGKAIVDGAMVLFDSMIDADVAAANAWRERNAS
jgi:hypothetical protein